MSLTLSNPFPGGFGYHAVWVAELGMFVAVGAVGDSSVAVATSPDGINWTPQGNPWPGSGGADIAWSPSLGLFVAISGTDTDAIQTSPDGINWTPRFSFVVGQQSGGGVAWSEAQGLFVATAFCYAGAGNKAVFTSPDGINWTPRSSPLNDKAAGPGSVTYSDALGLWIVLGGPRDGSGSPPLLITSPNGTAWTGQTTPFDGGSNAFGYGVASGNDRAVAVGFSALADGTNSAMSIDGTTWDGGAIFGPAPGTASYGFHVAWGSAMFCACGVSDDLAVCYATSADGLTWELGDSNPFGSGGANGVCWAEDLGVFLILGWDDAADATAALLVPPEPPPPPQVRFDGFPLSRFVVGNLAGEVKTILDPRTTDKAATFVLDGPSSFTALAPADDPEINLPGLDGRAFVSHNTRKIWWLRREGGDPSPVSGKVMRFAGAGGDSSIASLSGLSESEVWVEFRMRFRQPALTFWTVTEGQSAAFAVARAGGGGEIADFKIDSDFGDPGWEIVANFASSPDPSLGWHTYKFHVTDANFAALYIDGVLVTSGPVGTTATITGIDIGYDSSGIGVLEDPDAVGYIDDVTIGTTEGGSELLADGFEDGTFDAWSSTTGEVSVIDDPFLPLADKQPYVCRGAWLIETCDDVGGDVPVSRITAADSWQYLFSRPCRDEAGLIPDGDNKIVFAGDVPANEIAVQLLANTVLFDGDVWIDASDTSLVEPCSSLTDWTIEAGTSVGEAWQRLCATGFIDIVLRPIYDPLNRPGVLSELMIAPQFGSLKPDAVFAWDKPGRSIIEPSRMNDGSQLVNIARHYVGQGGPLNAEVIDDTDLGGDSIATYGKYYSSRFHVYEVDAGPLAVTEVLLRRNGQRTLTWTPTPEMAPAPFTEWWYGDFVAVWASRNLREPIAVDYDAFNPDEPGACGYERIYGWTVAIDDNGTERVRGILTSADTGGTEAP